MSNYSSARSLSPQNPEKKIHDIIYPYLNKTIDILYRYLKMDFIVFS